MQKLFKAQFLAILPLMLLFVTSRALAPETTDQESVTITTRIMLHILGTVDQVPAERRVTIRDGQVTHVNTTILDNNGNPTRLSFSRVYEDPNQLTTLGEEDPLKALGTQDNSL